MLDGIEARLRDWLPANAAVCCAEASITLSIPEAERIFVANAVRKRQAEFIAGRWCAHHALELIGHSAELIPVGALGRPEWPQGIIGSITHDAGICLAVVLQDSLFSGLGIDLFDTHRETEMNEIAHLILNEEEAASCNAAPDSTSYVKLVFSAKEAVVKAVSEKIGRFLDLREIRLFIEADSFRAELKDFPYRITGRWVHTSPFFLTLALLEHG